MSVLPSFLPPLRPGKGHILKELVKMVCSACGGSGGGKPDSAMGGGKDASKMDEALASVADFVATKVK